MSERPNSECSFDERRHKSFRRSSEGYEILEQSAEGRHIAKILGCYEQPFQPYIEKAEANPLTIEHKIFLASCRREQVGLKKYRLSFALKVINYSPLDATRDKSVPSTDRSADDFDSGL